MRRSEWLLLFLSREPMGAEDFPTLDPIRIQKGMFLLSKRGPKRDLYEFRPYNWGPFSSAIYTDLDRLLMRGLVEAEPVPGRTWRVYRTTKKGETLASELAEQVSSTTLNWLAEARMYVASRSFTTLLRDIYERFPKYAGRSLLR